MENYPKVGQILYQQRNNKQGEFSSASLLYIDTEPIPNEQLCVTWIAEMEDYNDNGLEVYTDANAGGTSIENISRIASDDDTLSFIKVMITSKSPKEALSHWLNNIENSEDYASLLPEEKTRLKKLITDFI